MDYLYLLQWLIYVAVIIWLLYILTTWNYKYFEKLGIPYVKPIPFFGNLAPAILQRKNLTLNLTDLYNTYPDSSFIGFFEFLTPVVMIRDPEIIKQITIKDFDHFVDHKSSIDENVDPLFGRNLFSMKGNKWRDMRTTLSPAFTGSKMRTMFGLIVDCGEQLTLYLKKYPNGVDLQLKNLLTRFSTDVIATTAFGIKVDSLENPENEFYLTGQKVANFSGIQLIKIFGFTSFPNLMKFFKIRFFEEKISNFFRTLVHDTIKMRDKEGIYRPDMIHLLMQARKGVLINESSTDKDDAGFATVQEFLVSKHQSHKRDWTDDDMTAQALIFFLAGFEPVSIVASFIAHELAINPDIQNRLQAEIDAFLGDNIKLNYENIQKMKYLDMVVSEGLRKWTPGGMLDRKCEKPYVLKDPANNVSIQLNPGDGIMIPTYAILNDAKYFPNPEKFDPDRFSDENRDKIQPSAYLPFGSGPRNCIGSRFALMEVKAILFIILSNFIVEPCSKTQNPLKLTTSMNMQAENGYWLHIKPRSLKSN